MGESCEYRDRKWQSQRFLSDASYKKGVKLLKCAAVLQYTLPGVPSVYYGDEAGMQGYKDPFNRGCYPWGNENKELVTFYEFLGKVRLQNKVFKEGDFIPVSSALGCVAYRRFNQFGDIMVIVNRNDHPITYRLPSYYKDFESLTINSIKGDEIFVDSCSFAILTKHL